VVWFKKYIYINKIVLEMYKIIKYIYNINNLEKKVLLLKVLL